jgi:CDP-glycerol glycerophosphotransferase
LYLRSSRDGRMYSAVTRYLAKLANLAKLFSALMVAKAWRLTGRGTEIWLVCERCDEARDNGYHFFAHVRTHHPEVRAYYVISPDAADRDRIAPLGQIVEWGSFRHYLYWCLAECLISAHPGKCAPEPNWCWRATRTGLVSHASVDLQHGVTAIQVPDFMHRSQARHDLVVAASAPERDYLQTVLQHGEAAVQLLGFCRFDALHEPCEVRRQVLLMPTWRRWFGGVIDKLGREAAIAAFRKSDYFRALNALLTSERLHAALEQTDHHLVFYPHYGAQDYIEAFERPHGRITIADRHRYDVQQLLKESKILITDFSSVSFDFAYMGKPVIYFLPDEERYFAEHFERGYFDFNKDGFGPVTRDAVATAAALEKLLRGGGDQSAAAYRERVERFFPLRDNRNCERTMAAVHKLVARRRQGA